MAGLVQRTLEYPNTAQENVGVLEQLFIESVSIVARKLGQLKVKINSIVITNVETRDTSMLREKKHQLGRVMMLGTPQYISGLTLFMENLLNATSVVAQTLLTGLIRMASTIELTEMSGCTCAGDVIFTTICTTYRLEDTHKRYAKFIGKEEEWQKI